MNTRPTRPKVALAMWPGLERAALRGAQRRRLHDVADVVNDDPLGELIGPRAAEVLGEADVLFTHWGCPRITEEALALAPRLALVTHGAGTVKELVSSAVFERDIVVTTAAAANAVPVAEYTLAAILWANKEVFASREQLRGVTPTAPGAWLARAARVGNVGKRVGLIGASLVGRAVIRLLEPFDLEVAVYDPFLTADEAASLGVVLVGNLDELCRTSDVVSVHAPELPSTRHMVGAPQLAAMGDGTWLINTARGSLVDHRALLDEVRTGRLSAVLDVTEPEPLPDSSPLLSLPNVIVTPHVAGAQGTELSRLSELAVDEIERFATGQPPRWPVREADLDRMA